MHPFNVTVPGKRPVTVHAQSALEAAIAVLTKHGLRYKDTKFRVVPVEKVQ